MAHILVYLQRTPHGLHPASAVALCAARDLASERGATVTSMAVGDLGTFDEGIAQACGRFGSDVVIFAGPRGLGHLHDRLNPVHVLTPWTREGLDAVGALRQGPAAARWITGGSVQHLQLDAVTGVVAGRTPWYDLPTVLEPEYEGEIDQANVAPWAHAAAAFPPVPFVFAAPPVFVHSTRPLAPAMAAVLGQLGSRPLDLSHIERCDNGTLLWFGQGSEPLPDALGGRGAAARVILCPGAGAAFDPSWALADWVLPGSWEQVLDQLQQPPWSAPAE